MTELYLSRLALNPRNRDVRRDLADCHKLHQQVLAAFPTTRGSEARAELGVLYRPEVDERTGVVTVLVQSAARPDWERLPEPRDGQPYLLPPLPMDNENPKRIDAFYEAIAVQRVLRFRLRANPTKRLSQVQPDGRTDRLTGKRVALLQDEDRLTWLRRKGEAAGFAVVEAQARSDRGLGANQIGWQSAEAGGDERRRLRFGAVVFDGLLRVTDAEAFRAALAQGIGSGKAYGFGLLSVAPA